jgi:hypothetical protein
MSECPDGAICTIFAPGSSCAPEDEQCRAGHLCRSRLAARVVVAGPEVVVEYAGRETREARERIAVHPHAGIGIAAERHLRRVAPDRLHVVGVLPVLHRRGEERFAHLHRVGRADQRDALDARGLARRALERHQRAHRVADEDRCLQLELIQQPQHPVGHLADGDERWPLRPAVPREIHRKHIEAVVAEVAALQAPPGMVQARTVHEHDRGLRRIDVVRRRIGEGLAAVDGDIHFCDAFRARPRSSTRSWTSSSPMDRRTVPGPMPDFFRSSSVMR